MTTPAPPAPSERRWAKPAEAADYLRVHPATLRRMVADGRVTAYNLSPTLTLFDLNEIDSLVLASARPTSGGSEQ